MEQVTIIGLDLAKRVFQVHGATADGRVALRKKLLRGQVLTFFKGLPPCVVAMEACATAHYWAREIGALGHDIRLVPPAYVKLFVKRQKNDAADAEAIAEAAIFRSSRRVRRLDNAFPSFPGLLPALPDLVAGLSRASQIHFLRSPINAHPSTPHPAA